MAQQVDVDKLIDYGGKSLAALGAWLLADVLFLPDVTVTPDFLAPFAGLLICTGFAVVAWRLVKP